MFKISPLSSYTLPRYGRTNPDSLRAWAAWLLRRGAGKLAALMLVAGLGLGLGACQDDKKVVFVTDGDQETEVADTTDTEQELDRTETVEFGETQETYDGLDGGISSEDADLPAERDNICQTNGYVSCENAVVSFCKDGELKQKACDELCPSIDPTTNERFYSTHCSVPFKPLEPCECVYGFLEGDATY